MAYLIGTAGHVDHGKTTLLAALTGIETDRLPEEKARGMTIDLGFAYLDLDGVGRVSIVDVPGHERFVKNMLAGAWGVDVALLCVAADEGVMPQTREHFEILCLLEARAMVVALTKCDMVDEETQDLVEWEVRELLSGTRYAEAPVVRVSALTGKGLQELKETLSKTLISLGPRRDIGSQWFLPIDRVFSVTGHGTVVTGTLAMGRVKQGDECELLPGGGRLRVRRVQVHGVEREYAEAGQRTALNLGGVKRENIERGQAVASPGLMVETRCSNIRVVALEPLKHGMRVRVHLGSGEFLGRLFLFDAVPDLAQIVFEEPVACTRGQRLVLRRYSPPTLIGGGVILTPSATRRKKSDPSVRELLAEGDESLPLEERVLSLITGVPMGIETSVMAEQLGMPVPALGDVLEQIKTTGKAFSFAGIWVSPENYRLLAEKLRDHLWRLHQSEAYSAGIAKSRLFAESGLPWSPKAWDRLLAQLHEDGFIRLMGAEVRHPEHEIKLTSRQQALLQRVLTAMRGHGAVPAGAETLAQELGVPPQAVREMWQLGMELGCIVRLEEDIYMSVETLEELKGVVRSLAPKFTVSQFRDAVGSTRKYVLPILQYFDSQKITRRVGDERVVVG
jgi:selenocysteine-specific elongation factor